MKCGLCQSACGNNESLILGVVYHSVCLARVLNSEQHRRAKAVGEVVGPVFDGFFYP